MKKKDMMIELLIDEKDKENGLEIISFVSEPAIESNFQYFSKEKKKLEFKTTDVEKRIVTGAAMIPDKKILRLDGEGNPYFVFFTKDTVMKCQESFAKYGKTKATNYEHNESELDDTTVVESWIVKDSNNDKSNALGFKDISEGTWMVSYKVDNDELWDKVKSGEVQGFSIEGMFQEKLVEMSVKPRVENMTDEDTYESIKSIISNASLSEDEMYDKIADIASKLK